MNSRISHAIGLAVVIVGSLGLGGCVVDNDAPSAEGMSSEGLTLTHETADRVEGTFHRREQTIAFELSVVPGGHRARIVDAAGAPLVETTYRDGVEDTTLLGGVARLRGAVDAAEPELEGDAHVFEQMSARPETSLIAELKEALRIAGVEPAFFSAVDAPAQPGLTPQSWLDIQGNWHINCGEYHDFPTWTFWGWTTFELWPENYVASASLRVLTPWYNPTEYAYNFSGTLYLRRQYAGYQGRVMNVTQPGFNGVCSRPLVAKAY
ncbi:hypothetical protein [Sorangium sp. So ce117]|uniref:hypothetical protein n=1 Tax=Sorangium sp. So ce117 TaxID=3133277 RepID=UPI003F61347F